MKFIEVGESSIDCKRNFEALILKISYHIKKIKKKN
jgi:hypothetical protein